MPEEECPATKFPLVEAADDHDLIGQLRVRSEVTNGADLDGGNAEALRVANAKKPFPKMLSSQPEGKTKMNDET
jgi:hypothetical protein